MLSLDPPGLVYRYWNEDPVHGCQIGTQCPIMHAKRDQMVLIRFRDVFRRSIVVPMWSSPLDFP
jgi:hypothetical protein